MRKAACADLAELRSAFVDGALSNPDRERLLNHLVECAHCRQDVEDLRAVRTLLKQSRNEPGPAPSDLSSRLVSIAGPESVDPLWTGRSAESSHPMPPEPGVCRAIAEL